ncbi:MAG: phosphonopyruvate decarboxylase [Proteobacteria bacterium]|nr:phosphonopyruvate decarboxylase [Pseudomonadota bacterium]
MAWQPCAARVLIRSCLRLAVVFECHPLGESTVTSSTQADWPSAIHQVFKRERVRQVAYVPDAGHRRLIELCRADDEICALPLTTEEEGMGVLAGAWLGGERGALLMQSSGVGNCINAIASLSTACRFPLFMLVTMRGEWGEGNPWQLPMGRVVTPVLETLGVRVTSVARAEDVEATVTAMLTMTYATDSANAVLLSQRLLGAKAFQ